jgi:hypothetical protein
VTQPDTTGKKTPLLCECGLPFAHIQRDVLVVLSRHNGDKHVNVITLAEIKKLLEQEQQQPA